MNRTAPIVEYETPYKMLRTTNIKGGFVDTENVRYVTRSTYERWTRRLVPRRGDVFLTREAPLGGVGRLTSEDKVFLGQRLFHYRANPKVMDSRFLAYVLQTRGVQGWIKSLGTGATVEHARVAGFHRIPIPAPPLEVQARIGGILSSYDDLIENNRRRIALLEESARLLYREWFVRFRFPGHEHVKIIDGLPMGWRKLAAAEIVAVRSGGTPKTDNSMFWGGPIRFFTPKDSANTPFVLDTEKTITEEGLRACNSQLYPTETLFITARGTVGKLNLALCPMAMNQSCYALLPKTYVGPHHLFLALGASVERIQSGATGAVFDAIIVATFDRFSLVLPSRSIAEAFAARIDPMFNQMSALTRQNEKLSAARDLLLPRLMRGEIAV